MISKFTNIKTYVRMMIKLEVMITKTKTIGFAKEKYEFTFLNKKKNIINISLNYIVHLTLVFYKCNNINRTKDCF